MNGLQNPFRKKSDLKNKKTVKTKLKLSHETKETTGEKAIFCSNTVFSLL